jgi:hypothetical protein
MKKIFMVLSFAILAFIAFSFSACGSRSPVLTGTAMAPAQIQERAGLQTVTLSPKVDVVMVVDNSESMEIKQQFLIKYIQYFTSALSSSQMLDIHLGVLPIYDGVRYGTAGYRNFLNEPFVVTSDEPYDIDKQLGFYQRGAMRGLVDPSTGKRGVTPLYFTHVGPDNVAQLNSTLRIGVDHFIAKSPLAINPADPIGSKPENEGSGPEFEEMFSPVAAALWNPMGSDNPNPGFFRDDAALVVIILTDGEDPDDKEVCTEIGPDNKLHKKPYYQGCDSNGLATYLTSLKHKDQSRLFTYGVLIPSAGETDTGCSTTQVDDKTGKSTLVKRDYSMKKPVSIERFLVNTGGSLKDNELDLCRDEKSAGEALTRFGNEIQKAASTQKIPLNGYPDVTQPIVVTYNGEDISNNPDLQIDWNANELVVQPTIKFANPSQDGKLTIKFTPTNPKSQHTHALTTQQ